MEFVEDFLRQYLTSDEVNFYLGMSFLGVLMTIGLGAFIFELKKRPRLIGALLGLVLGLSVVLIALFVRPYIEEDGIFTSYHVLVGDVNTINVLLLISCVLVVAPAFLAIWLMMAEGKDKNIENPFMQPQFVKNYTPLGAGGGMPAPSPAPTAYSTNEMQSVYHQAPRPSTEPIRPSGSIKGGLSPNKDSIFISYRRDDSSELVGRIYDHLVAKFGKEAIFRDVEAIPLGVDFRQYLRSVVGNCGILIAVIGDRWLDMRDAAGNLRLSDPNDFVRIEIASALQRNVPVVPVLIRNTQMPRESDLPEDLAELAFRNGTQVRTDPDFNHDMERLMQAIHLHLDEKA